MLIKAKELRYKDNLNSVSNTRPGYYKWWAPKCALDILLKELGASFSDIISDLETMDDLYCIYVGIAVKESLRDRLNWHVNQKHKKSAVASGTLSTLRQSISSVVAHDQYNESKTNEYIDLLSIECFECPYKIKSIEAEKEIHKIERNLLSEHLYILNIQENTYPKARNIKLKLKELRKDSK